MGFGDYHARSASSIGDSLEGQCDDRIASEPPILNLFSDPVVKRGLEFVFPGSLLQFIELG